MATNSRRRFLAATASAAGGAMAGFGDFGFLASLPRVSADDVKPAPGTVQFKPEIEPLVRLLEDSPRNKVIEKVADRIRRGTSYREVLTALLLAGVRNIQPRPSVGFKFHAVLVVNSAHLASLSAPDSDRWLPILWAIDQFKSSQARDVKEGDWTMSPVDESAVPKPHKAEQAFVEAMDRWDVDAADAAAAGLARGIGANKVFDLFAHYGMRDYRSIGHKAIFVANSWRALQCIGWRYAEPVLRSLSYALLNHEGEPNPADNDLKPDRAWRKNSGLAKSVRPDWTSGTTNLNATRIVLSELHSAGPEEIPKRAVEMLNHGTAASSIYDALLLGAGECLMRKPGIIGLHAVTTTNAMRYAFSATANTDTRLMLLLQNAAFLPMFRESARGRGKISDAKLLELQPQESIAANGDPLKAVFKNVSENRTAAARQLLGHLDAGNSPTDFINQARRLIFLKGTDSHDYKFSSAALEDFYNIAPEFRNRYLATSVFNLKGTEHKDNKLVDKIRSAMG